MISSLDKLLHRKFIYLSLSFYDYISELRQLISLVESEDNKALDEDIAEGKNLNNLKKVSTDYAYLFCCLIAVNRVIDTLF